MVFIRRLRDAFISFAGLRLPWRYSEEIVVSFQGSCVFEQTYRRGSDVFSDRYRSRTTGAFDRFHFAYDDDIFAFSAPRSARTNCEYTEGQTLPAFLNPHDPEDVWFDNRCQVAELIRATTDPVGRWAKKQSSNRRHS